MALFRNGPKLNLFALENFCYRVGVLSLYVGVVIGVAIGEKVKLSKEKQGMSFGYELNPK